MKTDTFLDFCVGVKEKLYLCKNYVNCIKKIEQVN